MYCGAVCSHGQLGPVLHGGWIAGICLRSSRRSRVLGLVMMLHLEAQTTVAARVCPGLVLYVLCMSRLGMGSDSGLCVYALRMVYM